MIDTLNRVNEALGVAVESENAAWAALTGLTAGEGLGFNRAFVLIANQDRAVGWMGVGPSSREEAGKLWADIRQHGVKPIERLFTPAPGIVQAERLRLHHLLGRLSVSLSESCRDWDRPFIGRPHHQSPCVRHWLEVLGSESLAVLPLKTSQGPWSVVIADNFVTRAVIDARTLEAAQTVVHSLSAALDRTRLVGSLQEEQRRRLAAEHATTLLETARTLAHDLKNPLALAGGLARELLAEPPPHGDALFKRLHVIAAAVQRAEQRLTQLGEELASRSGAVALCALDVGALVERVAQSFRPLAESRHIRLVLYRPARTLLAIAEASLLERCLENLLGNGLQALREARATTGIVRLAAYLKDDWVRVDIADNGPALPSLLRSDPFAGGVTTRSAGTGLGLVSVRRLVDAMGGRVEYDEKEPGWVRFTVFLRRAP